MMPLSFIPFPELHTPRLLLRRLTLEDAPEIFFLRSDERVIKHLGRDPATSTEQAREFILKIQGVIETGEGILWGITLNSKPGEVIGTICYWNIRPEHFRAEIGYALHPDWWGKGIMAESIEPVVCYGFEKMKLHSIEARLSATNIACASTLEKSGFTEDAHFKEDFFFNGQFSDTLVYSKLSNQ